MISFTILGKIPAKSSGRQVIKNKKTGKTMVISTKAYYQYEDSFINQIKALELDKLGLPVNQKNRIAVFLTIYDTAKRQDIDSFPKTVFDCLQKAGVIQNDNKIDYCKIIRLVEKDNPRVVIYLYELPETKIKELI